MLGLTHSAWWLSSFVMGIMDSQNSQGSITAGSSSCLSVPFTCALARAVLCFSKTDAESLMEVRRVSRMFRVSVTTELLVDLLRTAATMEEEAERVTVELEAELLSRLLLLLV